MGNRFSWKTVWWKEESAFCLRKWLNIKNVKSVNLMIIPLHNAYFTYLKIYKCHLKLNILASMWIQFHTKSTTMCSNDIDAYVSIWLPLNHCYNCDLIWQRCSCKKKKIEKKYINTMTIDITVCLVFFSRTHQM